MPDKPQDKTEELDFTKLSPGMQGYINELRDTARKARTERDELKRQLEANPPLPDVRTLSKKEYRRTRAEAMNNIIRQEREQRDATILTNLTNVDVQKMSPEEYRQLKNKLARRG